LLVSDVNEPRRHEAHEDWFVQSVLRDLRDFVVYRRLKEVCRY
jgi:hypothetical protein